MTGVLFGWAGLRRSLRGLRSGSGRTLTMVHPAVAALRGLLTPGASWFLSGGSAVAGVSGGTSRGLLRAFVSHRGVAVHAAALRAVPGFMGCAPLRGRARHLVLSTRGHSAVPVGVTFERLSLFLSFTECRRALAGDALLSAAAGQDGKRQEPASDG